MSEGGFAHTRSLNGGSDGGDSVEFSRLQSQPNQELKQGKKVKKHNLAYDLHEISRSAKDKKRSKSLLARSLKRLL